MKTLREVYESHKADLETLYKKLQEEGLWEDVSYPLLMSTWDNEPIPETMLFGQETNGWGDFKLIEDLMFLYRDFNLGDYYNSLFWRYLWEMSMNLGLKGSHPFLWNNIHKFGKVDSAGRPNPRVTELENQYFNVLKEELQVITPKICIFFTGPNYDADLKAKLPDLEILPVDGYAINEVAKLKNQYLPEHSYRTYHPGYGNRYSDWYKELLKHIANKAKTL